MSKSPEEAVASMVAGLEAKTGKSLVAWLKVTRASGLQKHSELVAMLKKDHGIGHGYANLITHKTLASDSVAAAAKGEDLVGAQYAGPKAALRPIYDALAKKAQALGKDVELSPKKEYVSLRRSKQFGLIQPSTATRVDLGLNLKGVPPAGRLEAAGSFSGMVTHRIRLASAKDVDRELEGWLKNAYAEA
jgi:hypothetical protein